jgi:hypothetical protein
LGASTTFSHTIMKQDSIVDRILQSAIPSGVPAGKTQPMGQVPTDTIGEAVLEKFKETKLVGRKAKLCGTSLRVEFLPNKDIRTTLTLDLDDG